LGLLSGREFASPVKVDAGGFGYESEREGEKEEPGGRGKLISWKKSRCP